jgi:Ca2+-binding EF-hand superfamily protein
MQAAQLRIKQAKEREALSKKKQSIKSEFDPLEESFSDAQIARLKAEYSKINTVDPSGDSYKKLTAMLDKLDKPTLEKLAGAGIKFVSGLAKNRVNRTKNEELSPKQKALDKNKNGKIDGSDLAKLRNEEDMPQEFKQGGKPLADKFKRAFEKLGIKADVKIKTVGNVSTNEAVVKGKGYDNPENERKGPEGKVPMTSLMPGHNEKAARLAAVQAKGRLVKGKAQSASQKEEVEIDEAKSDYDLYHKDFSTAVQHAIKTAEKRGYQVNMDDWHDKVATGPRKPSEGKTNSYSITLMDKNGKPVKKALQMQVYNKGGQNPYELNMYIEEIQLGESDAYDKDVKPSDKPHDKEAAAKRAKLAALAARKKMAENDDKNINDLFAEAIAKKEKEATAKDKNKSVKSGDKLSGKQEPVEIQPELKEEK